MDTDQGKDPYQVADIENDWGSRHLFRMPYSLHDGSWLVALPIEPEEIDEFEKSDAEMDKIDFETDFFIDTEEAEATNLAVQAMDSYMKGKRKDRKRWIKGRIESLKGQKMQYLKNISRRRSKIY